MYLHPRFFEFSMKEPNGTENAIVSSVVLWAKYINANGYRCCCGTKTLDTTKKNPLFSLLGTQTLSFLNSSISRWFLNTFFDLSTTRKKSRRTKSFFSPLRYSMQKDFNCLLDHSFFHVYIFFFLPLFNLKLRSSIIIMLPIYKERWGQSTTFCLIGVWSFFLRAENIRKYVC